MDRNLKEIQVRMSKSGNIRPVSINTDVADVKTISTTTPLLQCIGRLKHHKVLFAVDNIGLLVGSITNGDLRRFLEANPKVFSGYSNGW